MPATEETELRLARVALGTFTVWYPDHGPRYTRGPLSVCAWRSGGDGFVLLFGESMLQGGDHPMLTAPALLSSVGANVRLHWKTRRGDVSDREHGV